MYHFIINPSAGNGRAQKSWTKIQKKLAGHGGVCL